MEETIIHVLRECLCASVVWMNLANVEARDLFFTSNLDQWISLNLSNNLGDDSNLDWSVIWANAYHLLWTWHNKEVHVDDFVRPFRPWKVGTTKHQAI